MVLLTVCVVVVVLGAGVVGWLALSAWRRGRGLMRDVEAAGTRLSELGDVLAGLGAPPVASGPPFPGPARRLPHGTTSTARATTTAPTLPLVVGRPGGSRRPGPARPASRPAWDVRRPR